VWRSFLSMARIVADRPCRRKRGPRFPAGGKAAIPLDKRRQEVHGYFPSP